MSSTSKQAKRFRKSAFSYLGLGAGDHFSNYHLVCILCKRLNTPQLFRKSDNYKNLLVLMNGGKPKVRPQISTPKNHVVWGDNWADVEAAEFDLIARGVVVPIRPQQQKTEPIPHDDKRLTAFYDSWEWKRARYDALKRYGRKCSCCGNTPENGAKIVVDHIKPIRLFWALRLDKTNLQILCDDCNMGKGSRDQTDWRPYVLETKQT